MSLARAFSRSCFAALVLLALAMVLPASAQKSTLTFGSTNATSSNYALAVAMSKAIKKELPNANVSMIETGASVDNVRGERPAIPLENANEASVGQHVGEMRAQRQKTLALVDSLSPDDFDRTASQRVFGELTVLQWLRSYYRHDRMHYDQVRGVEPEYRPRYAGGAEPDQRRG